ncbi:zinc finger BED domain-containing protein 1-like [Dendronephthya gigantea]|uniref:zinc finger BED domain-containing protein 1-like n=1 Tax=Dendronephthya gigantea TaxID=151771 RepID=UPI00106AD7CF|nr:zinc finger BED domain-containing protein 1-like [Dendronephthya gigantea]
MWSSHGLTPYLGYTLHWIDDDWNLRTRNLGTKYVPEDHTAANIARSMNDTLQHWKLDENNQVVITTDNGANIKKACQQNKWVNIPCFGHNLHLAITNTLAKEPKLCRAMGVCKKVVSAFGTSWKRRRDLQAAQLQDEPEKKIKKLASECPTRWGSTQRMISRVLHNKSGIRRVLGGDRETSHLVPTWQDLEVLECLNNALSPLKDFTDILSASSYITISVVKPILHRLSTVELATKDEDLPLARQLKSEILRRLKSRYQAADLQRLLNVASFLDARYKTDFMLNNVDNEEGDDEPSQVQFVKEELLSQAVFLNESSAADDEILQPPQKKAKLSLGALTSLKQPKISASSAQSPRQRLSREIEQYLKYSVIDGDENPLEWWRRNEREFPLLSQLGKKYLCIQASSSPSERLFSKAGLIATPARANLKPEKVDMLVFLAENL